MRRAALLMMGFMVLGVFATAGQAEGSIFVTAYRGWAWYPRRVYIPSGLEATLPPVRLGHPFSRRFYFDLRHSPLDVFGGHYPPYYSSPAQYPCYPRYPVYRPTPCYGHGYYNPYFPGYGVTWHTRPSDQPAEEPRQRVAEWVPPGPQQEHLSGKWKYYQNMGHWQIRMAPRGRPIAP